MTKESVLEFAEDIDLNFDEIALPDSVIDFTDATEPQETEGDDEVPEVDEKSEPVSKRGEMYELGNSILMCGDSTNAEDVARLMGGEKADLVLTDPPYGISVVGENGKVGADNLAKNGIYMPVKGDETTKTTEDFIKVCKELGYEKQIIFGGNYFIQFLPFSDSWLIWDKRGDMASNNFADGEMAWCSFHTPVRIYKQVWSGMIKEGEHGKRVHPTQKPVKMLADILKDFSAENELVFDGFGGSGSVLIACEQTGRRCRMIEYEPYYCDIIRKRYTIWCKENNKPLTSGCLDN
jgi:16S rRNA G966 N2-methylase RsmD